MTLKLPENPTPAQLKSIALAVIRTTFEDTATNIGDIEPMDGNGWKTTYEADGIKYAIEYDPKDGFGKIPIGAVKKK